MPVLYGVVLRPRKKDKPMKKALFATLVIAGFLAVNPAKGSADGGGQTPLTVENAAMFHERGVIRLNDLLRARVALSGAVQKRERAKADADIAVTDLYRWLGRDIHSETKIENIEALQPVHVNLDELIETGFRQRPQIQATWNAPKGPGPLRVLQLHGPLRPSPVLQHHRPDRS